MQRMWKNSCESTSRFNVAGETFLKTFLFVGCIGILDWSSLVSDWNADDVHYMDYFQWLVKVNSRLCDGVFEKCLGKLQRMEPYVHISFLFVQHYAGIAVFQNAVFG